MLLQLLSSSHCLHLVFPFSEVEGKLAYCTVSLKRSDTSRGRTAPALIFKNQGIILCARVWWLSVVATHFKGFMPYNRQTDRAARAHPPDVESDSLQWLCCLSAAGIDLKHTYWQGHNHQTDMNLHLSRKSLVPHCLSLFRSIFLLSLTD